MADCVSAARYVGKCFVTKCIWPPITRHFDYCWYFRDNVQVLRDEVVNLERERGNVDQKKEEARRRTEGLTDDVQQWSQDVAQKLEQAATILRDCDDLRAWTIITSLRGESVVKTTKELEKLRNKAGSIRISDLAPTPAERDSPHERIRSFESRRLIEEDIMKSLTDNHVHVIAICGAGGVGKTTMARRIEDRVRGEKLFDEVVKVVVSQQVDLLRIQKEIAEFLDLELSGHNLVARARRLYARLADSKRKLIIIDDVWNRLNLMDLGIPSGNEFVGCKIILTSRVKDACNKMNANKIISMEVLTEEEAWTFFKEKAGSCVEGSELRPIAEAVAKECKGLPIAVVTVGEALKRQQSKHVWNDALSQLKGDIPIVIPEVIRDVYKPLKLSYDFLEDESLQSLFLLCCLFPEDRIISIEQLAFYSIGLRLFEGIRNIEEGRSKTHSLVEKLKGRFLLMSSSVDDFVMMHDVVRDVAIFIGSKERDGFLKSLEVSSMDSSRENLSSNCKWMSVDLSIKNAKLPSDFQSLRLLIMLDTTYRRSSQVFYANVICFKRIEELNVLYFEKINLQPPPSTLNLLKNLRTLHLWRYTVEDVSIFGELTSLKILCIIECHGIEELSADIGRLTCLRLLEVSGCHRLKRIVAGVISCLVRLEELKIVDSFDKWEGKGSQREERNAGLSELESLPNLTSLEIDISDCNLVAEKICLSQQPVRYRIRFAKKNTYFDIWKNERCMDFKDLPRDVKVEKWIHQLVRSTQSLVIDGDGSNNFNLAETQNLRNLVLTNCSTVKKLVNTIDCTFPVLEHLKLQDLTELEEIIPDYSNHFQQLQRLEISKLPKLGYLWKTSNVTPSNLKCIIISDCPNLRYLFSVATARSIVQIEQLEMRRLPKLEYLWKTRNQNVTPSNLKCITISGCPNLRYLFSVATARSILQIEQLTIEYCERIEQVLANEMESNKDDSVTIEFPKLKELTIGRCERIKRVLVNEMESNTDDSVTIEFPKLKLLKFVALPNLAAFLHVGVEIIELPQLTTLSIRDCPKLGTKIGKCPNLGTIMLENFKGLQHRLSSCCSRDLKVLRIANDDTLEEIFFDEIKDGELNRRVIFPELTELELLHLPCLTTFYRGIESIEFPKLETMKIGGDLRRLSDNSLLAMDSEATDEHDHRSLHLVCNPKVEIPGLKHLHLLEFQDSISSIWCRHIPINFFRNLGGLDVNGVNGIRNLMSSSIAKNLVNLDWLVVNRCQEMTEVIEDEEETPAAVVFPALNELFLGELPKLRSLCQWEHPLELPSLETVDIDDCPAMETFTLGLLSTPKLSTFGINDNECEVRDLNGGIRHQFRTKMKNGDGEDDEEQHSSEDKKETNHEEKIES